MHWFLMYLCLKYCVMISKIHVRLKGCSNANFKYSLTSVKVFPLPAEDLYTTKFCLVMDCIVPRR